MQNYVPIKQGQKAFSGKGHTVTVVGFVDQKVHIAVVQPCLCGTKTATEDTQKGRCSQVPVNLCLQAQM